MKKQLLIAIGIIVVFIIGFNYCNTKNTNSSTDTPDSQNTGTNGLKIYINNVGYQCFFKNENYARIVCDSMVLNKDILNKVVDSLKLDDSIIYFHIPTLKGSSEEFASYTNGDTFVYDNPPRNKEEVSINLLISNITNEISLCELVLNKTKFESVDIEFCIITFTDAANAYQNSSEFATNKRVNEARLKLKQKLISAQIKTFPKMRKAYALTLKEKLWREDVDVKSNDKSITLTGGTFASNKNKEDTYIAMRDRLEQLRFKRVNFKWTKYDDEYTYWTIETPSDGTIIDIVN